LYGRHFEMKTPPWELTPIYRRRYGNANKCLPPAPLAPGASSPLRTALDRRGRNQLY
jgi:hypothetical protein